MNEVAAETLVIGLGNPLMGDDGLGLVALERLTSRWRLPPLVRPVDGGTLGLSLLPLIEGAEAVLVLDAIDAGQSPGSLVRLNDDQLPRMLGHRISCHQSGLPEVLALGQLRGTLPPRLAAIGLQPACVRPGGLSHEVARALDDAVRAAATQLAAWGHHLVHRTSERARPGAIALDLPSVPRSHCDQPDRRP